MVVIQEDSSRENIQIKSGLDYRIDEFREFATELAKLGLAGNAGDPMAGDIVKAKVLAELACDSSRNTIFRLHSASSSELKQLVEAFDSVARIIASWDTSVFGEDSQLVADYGIHIEQRADRLRGFLPDYRY